MHMWQLNYNNNNYNNYISVMEECLYTSNELNSFLLGQCSNLQPMSRYAYPTIIISMPFL